MRTIGHRSRHGLRLRSWPQPWMASVRAMPAGNESEVSVEAKPALSALGAAAKNMNAPAAMVGALHPLRSGIYEIRRNRNPLFAAPFAAAGRHPMGIKVAPGFMHIAAQLAAFFG